jgi:Tfp pilus assembly protein PilZ
LRSRRKHERFIRRLETEFSTENKNYRAISSDFSETGLFIRTNHAFTQGSLIDIKVHLPDGTTSKLKGKVMRAVKTPIVSIKNGMGVYLLEKDSHYINFIKSFSTKDKDKVSSVEVKAETEIQAQKEKTPESAPDDFLILSCSNCRVKNKVHKSRISMGPKCGKCRSRLVINLA